MELILKSLTPLLVVGGWIVVYQLQALQARRKLLREEVEKTRQAVEKLLEMALKFHTTPFDEDKRTAILLSFNDIERRYTLFPKIARARSRCLPHAVKPTLVEIDPNTFVTLRKAITLEHFEDAEAEPLKHNHKQISDIRVAAVAMIEKIDKVLVSALD